jgi:amidohydrolase
VVLALFDMDVLPVLEETGVPYASQNPGVMHACGHDGHIAIGLTVAQILAENRTKFLGSIKFVFQPAEEGLGGAKAMIADGVLQNPKPDYSLALHLWNEKPFGWLGITPGPAMSASDCFQIKLVGKGGHGASPHLTADPIVTGAQIISSIQSIVSRNVPPLKSAVITIGSVRGGDAFNVIPQSVEMKGTIRSFEPDIRSLVIKRLTDCVTHVAQAYNCHAEIEIWQVTPAVVNDPFVTDKVKQVAETLFPACEIDEKEQTMGSEDMAYMMSEIPGCYFFIGSANSEKNLDAPHHHPRFDIDEQALPVAVALMSASIVAILTG